MWGEVGCLTSGEILGKGGYTTTGKNDKILFSNGAIKLLIIFYVKQTKSYGQINRKHNCLM